MYVDSVKKTNTIRGCTEFELHTASRFILPKNENEIMRAIMFGVQTAKNYQRNGEKYQDEMKDDPKLRDRRKTQNQTSIRLKKTRLLKLVLRIGRRYLRIGRR